MDMKKLLESISSIEKQGTVNLNEGASKKDIMDTLSFLRKTSKEVEQGTPFNGSLTSTYVNDIYGVYSWLEANGYARDPKLQSILKGVMDLRAQAKALEQSNLRMDDRNSKIANAIVNELYPLQQWIEMNTKDVQQEGSEMDRSPGSPYDRGGADADYDRSPRPHKMVSNQQGGKDMVKLTDPKEIEEYMAGYEDGEKSKGGPTHYYDDDLDETKEDDDDYFSGLSDGPEPGGPYDPDDSHEHEVDEGTLQEVRSSDAITRDIKSSSGAAQNKLMAEMLAAIEYHYMQIQNAGDTGLDMLGQHAPTFSYFEKKYDHDIPTMFKKAKFQGKKQMLDELEKISDQLDFDMERNDNWLEEGNGMAQLYKDEFEDHMHAEHSARAEGDDEAAREHLEAAEEAAENYHNITGQKLVSHDYDGDSPYITNPDIGNNYGDFDDEDDDLYEGIVGAMKKFRNIIESGDEQLNELSPELLDRAAKAADDKFQKSMDPRVHGALGGGYMNPLAKHYQNKKEKFQRGAEKARTRDAFKKVGISPADKRKVPQISRMRGNQGVLDEKAINPNAVGMAKAKEMYGYGDKPAHDLPKKVIKKAHEIAKKVDESLTVTATDNDAYSLMRMVSLAGVPGAQKVEPLEPYSPYAKPVTGVIYDGGSTGCSAVNCSDSNCPTHGHDMMPMEEYANEPDESTCEVSSVTDKAGLGGLNGPKSQHPYAANRSDNPLDEVDIAERVTKLAGMYNKIKGK